MGTTTLKIRDEFLISSLFIETSIDKFLTEELTGSDENREINPDFPINSLAFSQKVDLFLETSGLSIIDQSKVSVYREIKGAFGKEEIYSVEEYLKSSDKNDDFLLILYPQSNAIPREEKLVNACYLLMNDVSDIISKTTQKPEVKMQRGIFHKISENIGKLTFIFSFLLMR